MSAPFAVPPTYDKVGKLAQSTDDDETSICRTGPFCRPTSAPRTSGATAKKLATYRDRYVAISFVTHTLVTFNTDVEWQQHQRTGARTYNDKIDLKEVQLYVANYVDRQYAVEVSTPLFRTFFICDTDTDRMSWLMSMIEGGARFKTASNSVFVDACIPDTALIVGKHGWMEKKGLFKKYERRFYRTITLANDAYLAWSHQIDCEIQSKDNIKLSGGTVESVVACHDVPSQTVALADADFQHGGTVPEKYREFELLLTKGKKRLIFRCDTIMERDSWIRVLAKLSQIKREESKENSTTKTYTTITSQDIDEKRAADSPSRHSRSSSSRSRSTRSRRHRNNSNSLIYSPPSPQQYKTSTITRDIRSDGGDISIEQLNAMIIEWDQQQAKAKAAHSEIVESKMEPSSVTSDEISTEVLSSADFVTMSPPKVTSTLAASTSASTSTLTAPTATTSNNTLSPPTALTSPRTVDPSSMSIVAMTAALMEGAVVRSPRHPMDDESPFESTSPAVSPFSQAIRAAATSSNENVFQLGNDAVEISTSASTVAADIEAAATTTATDTTTTTPILSTASASSAATSTSEPLPAVNASEHGFFRRFLQRKVAKKNTSTPTPTATTTSTLTPPTSLPVETIASPSNNNVVETVVVVGSTVISPTAATASGFPTSSVPVHNIESTSTSTSTCDDALQQQQARIEAEAEAELRALEAKEQELKATVNQFVAHVMSAAVVDVDVDEAEKDTMEEPSGHMSIPVTQSNLIPLHNTNLIASLSNESISSSNSLSSLLIMDPMTRGSVINTRHTSIGQHSDGSHTESQTDSQADMPLDESHQTQAAVRTPSTVIATAASPSPDAYANTDPDADADADAEVADTTDGEADATSSICSTMATAGTPAPMEDEQELEMEEPIGQDEELKSGSDVEEADAQTETETETETDAVVMDVAAAESQVDSEAKVETEAKEAKTETDEPQAQSATDDHVQTKKSISDDVTAKSATDLDVTAGVAGSTTEVVDADAVADADDLEADIDVDVAPTPVATADGDTSVDDVDVEADIDVDVEPVPESFAEADDAESDAEAQVQPETKADAVTEDQTVTEIEAVTESSSTNMAAALASIGVVASIVPVPSPSPSPSTSSLPSANSSSPVLTAASSSSSSSSSSISSSPAIVISSSEPSHKSDDSESDKATAAATSAPTKLDVALSSIPTTAVTLTVTPAAASSSTAATSQVEVASPASMSSPRELTSNTNTTPSTTPRSTTSTLSATAAPEAEEQGFFRRLFHRKLSKSPPVPAPHTLSTEADDVDVDLDSDIDPPVKELLTTPEMMPQAAPEVPSPTTLDRATTPTPTPITDTAVLSQHDILLRSNMEDALQAEASKVVDKVLKDVAAEIAATVQKSQTKKEIVPASTTITATKTKSVAVPAANTANMYAALATKRLSISLTKSTEPVSSPSKQDAEPSQSRRSESPSRSYSYSVSRSSHKSRSRRESSRSSRSRKSSHRHSSSHRHETSEERRLRKEVERNETEDQRKKRKARRAAEKKKEKEEDERKKRERANETPQEREARHAANKAYREKERIATALGTPRGQRSVTFIEKLAKEEALRKQQQEEKEEKERLEREKQLEAEKKRAEAESPILAPAFRAEIVTPTEPTAQLILEERERSAKRQLELSLALEQEAARLDAALALARTNAQRQEATSVLASSPTSEVVKRLRFAEATAKLTDDALQTSKLTDSSSQTSPKDDIDDIKSTSLSSLKSSHEQLFMEHLQQIQQGTRMMKLPSSRFGTTKFTTIRIIPMEEMLIPTPSISRTEQSSTLNPMLSAPPRLRSLSASPFTMTEPGTPHSETRGTHTRTPSFSSKMSPNESPVNTPPATSRTRSMGSVGALSASPASPLVPSSRALSAPLPIPPVIDATLHIPGRYLITWDSSKKRDIDSMILIDADVRLYMGMEQGEFARRKSSKQVKVLDPKLCFTIETKKRTLDLVAKDQATFNQYMYVIATLIAIQQHQKQTQVLANIIAK